MARTARNTSIDPAQIQVVHVWNRCVRRAFLCGVDDYSGRDYEHRRDWARQRLEHLASLFAIDCITYSMMTNHTHQILRSRPDIAASWDDRTVATRWLQISPDRDAGGKPLEPKESEIQMILSNPAKVAELGVMCRKMLSVGWDGQLYDCDFNQMLELGTGPSQPKHIRQFDFARLSSRIMVTGRHCFGCTAGAGSGCLGAIDG